ncbi:bZIP transcription factor 11-like [Lycium barbarum]|uniref:bZIP transcription factor 11-like n=1 Tax=Lycium barbarum TaxID=112863 RepID=UPI00293F34C5|nr:bZIP transcription factor 11-like [Lycium barbarum]
MNHCYKVMASSNGTSSGSLIQHRKCGSEDDHLRQVIIDERKRKRMISNRESARRSRMKKHEYLDELIARVDLLKEENNQIVTNINMVIQLYLNVEAENSVLKAQIAELSHRLQSLKEINRRSSANGAAIIQGTEDLWNYNRETMSNVNDGDDFLKIWNFAPWESAYHGLC